ncbi:MAG: SDR family NAD(P)-dependent oxidoreductase [Enterobacterales bacterium]|nr:SDR family NAD(P)-dependent oxidoreductase [Enterobacterales bacterium]
MTQTALNNKNRKLARALSGTGVFGKVFWITGASSGIGKELAIQLADLGAVLILSSRREDTLYRVKESLRNSEQHQVIALDLAMSDSLEAKVDQAWLAFGHIDYLVNNGGISQRSLCLETQEAVDRQIMEVDYFGTIALTKQVAKRMINEAGGTIISISSVAGKVGSHFRSAYSAAKHALIGFMDCLRAEISDQGVRILVVCPGWVQTDVSRNALTGDMSQFGQMDHEIANGMPVDIFVKKLLKVIDSSREEAVIASGLPWFAYQMRRLLPNQFHKLIRKIYKR